MYENPGSAVDEPSACGVFSVTFQTSPGVGVPSRLTYTRVVAVLTWTSLFSPKLAFGSKARSAL